MAGIGDQCVAGLGRCLAATTDRATREGLLSDVFAVYRWDALDHGGYGMDDAPRKVLLGGTTPAESALDLLRRLVAVLLAHGTKAARADAAELRQRLDALERGHLRGATAALWVPANAV
ncbi:MAG: hypothetical protein ACKVU4_03405 [Phycisphaerales bacterium]